MGGQRTPKIYKNSEARRNHGGGNLAIPYWESLNFPLVLDKHRNSKQTTHVLLYLPCPPQRGPITYSFIRASCRKW